MNAKRGLGRGLASLIPEEEESTSGLLEIPINHITPNPHQPRTLMHETDLQELADSIKEHGILQPLVVTQTSDGKYQLIAGERRWRASKLAGLAQVPVILKDVAPQEMLELALVENVQRADLNPLEEAAAYQQLVEEFGLSAKEVGQRLGKHRTTVINKMRLLQAAPEIQQAIMQNAEDADFQITEGHARALAGLNSHEEQVLALNVVLKRKLSVRRTEELVRNLKEERDVEPRHKVRVDPEIRSLEERLLESLGQPVKIKHSRKKNGRSRLVIYYHSNEEFRELYERITGETL